MLLLLFSNSVEEILIPPHQIVFVTSIENLKYSTDSQDRSKNSASGSQFQKNSAITSEPVQ